MRFFRALLSGILAIGVCLPTIAWADESAWAQKTTDDIQEYGERSGALGTGNHGEASLPEDSVIGSDKPVAAPDEVNPDGKPGEGDIETDVPSSTEPSAPSNDDSVSILPDADGENDGEKEVAGEQSEAFDKEARSLLNNEKAINLPAVATIGAASNPTQVIDVPSANIGNYVGVQLYASNTTPAQRFQLKARSDGFYTIVNVNSGKVLDVRSGSAQSGAVVQQYTSNGTDAQAWSFISTGDVGGSYYLASKLKDTLVLDVRGSEVKNGAQLQLSVAKDTESQKFSVQGVQAVLSNGTYILGTQATKTVLDVSAADTSNGANIQMYAKNGTPAQRFTFTYDASTGYYTVSTFASGKVLDVAGASASWKTNVHQYASNGSNAQKWTVEKASDGKNYNILSACGGTALDVADASDVNGANVQVYGRNGTNAQAWTIEMPPTTKLDGLFTMCASANKNYVIDIAAGSMANGANVQLYGNNGSWAQKFQIKMYDENHCVIYSLRSGKVLEVARSSSNVQQYEYNGSGAQLWQPVSYGGGAYGFQSKETGLFLDVASGVMSNGSNIQVWEGNGSAAQRFFLAETDRSESVVEGSYIIRNVLSNNVLDMLGAGVTNGTQAQLHQSNGTFAQKFKVLAGGSDSYYFVNVHSSKYLDVDTGTKTILQQWDRGEGSNQKWKFYPVEGSEGAYYIKSSYTDSYLTNVDGVLTLGAYEGAVKQQFLIEKTAAFKVYLDAGHGYNSNGNGMVDSGAVSLGYRENDLTTDLVKRVMQQLDTQGIEYYVGNGKSYWTRHQDAVNMGCSTFLSIHFNSGGGQGTESFIHSYNAAPGSPAFQNVIHPYLLKGTGLVNRGVKRDEFAVCGGRLPSVLAEIAFVDSLTDMSTYQLRKDMVASNLALGLKQASQNNACGWY